MEVHSRQSNKNKVWQTEKLEICEKTESSISVWLENTILVVE